jgi:hypothetical protein
VVNTTTWLDWVAPTTEIFGPPNLRASERCWEGLFCFTGDLKVCHASLEILETQRKILTGSVGTTQYSRSGSTEMDRES